ncbi:putative DNA processing protein [Enterobacter phage EC151]|nr:putative DNA processing protein [Enterobacter phage EC151]
MNKVYAGIGSRKTPTECCHAMARLAGRLGEAGWTLRSGRALGADSAFESGARAVRGSCEIYLPNKHNYMTMAQIAREHPELWDHTRYIDEVEGSVLGCKIIARLLHPNGKNLDPYALELHARNTYQIIGQNLNSPVQFVACWTEGGRGEGGTGQALRLAKMLNIPIIDFGVYDTPQGWYHMADYIAAMYGVK